VPGELAQCLSSGPETPGVACPPASGLAEHPNPYFGEPSGTLLSYARNRLAHHVTAGSVSGEHSVFPYVAASFEARGNPEHAGGGLSTLSETVSVMSHHGEWGDLLQSEAGTASGTAYGSLELLREEALVRM